MIYPAFPVQPIHTLTHTLEESDDAVVKTVRTEWTQVT
jgi:hypothetical protein